MSQLIVDTECYKKFWYVAFLRLSDGFRIGFEISRRTTSEQDIETRRRIKTIMEKNTTIGYNSIGYDNPMIAAAIDGATNEELKRYSDRIIQGNLKPWEIGDALGIYVPQRWRCIDLMEPQPNARANLKTLNGRCHGKRMQDLPYPPDADLTDEEIDNVIDYCLVSDLDATNNLLNELQEPLALRKALGAEYGQNFMSKSDSQIGEAIVKTRYKEMTGITPKKPASQAGTTFTYPVPEFISFKTPELQEVLERLRTAEFRVGADGKTIAPKWLEQQKIYLGDSIYQMGIGGLHSTEAGRIMREDDDYALVDADVASQYPAAILSLGLVPVSLGPEFLVIYRKIREDRVAAKKRGKAIKVILKTLADTPENAEEIRKLKIEQNQCEVKDKGLKIALNGVYGKLGSKYSFLYGPRLLCSVTLTCQLTVLMLIEAAELAGVSVVSGNTDGVLFRVPRHMFNGLDGDRLIPAALQEITSAWEAQVGFDLEFAQYTAIANQSVNSYLALKADGGHKRKGAWFLNPWSTHKDDVDPRAKLMKNPAATICSDACLAMLKYGTPIEETIHNCVDIRQFITVVNATGGAAWRGRYLGKVVRYYWSTDGDEILKTTANAKGTYAKVPETDGAAPCMTLPDELPDDIDYARYIYETRAMLVALGFYEKPVESRDLIRFTKANRAPLMTLWAAAL